MPHCNDGPRDPRNAPRAAPQGCQDGPLSGGTFRAELLDVAVGDTYIVAIQRATASRGERTLDVTGCQLIDVSDGLIQRVRGHYSDQSALDAFWTE